MSRRFRQTVEFASGNGSPGQITLHGARSCWKRQSALGPCTSYPSRFGTLERPWFACTRAGGGNGLLPDGGLFIAQQLVDCLSHWMDRRAAGRTAHHSSEALAINASAADTSSAAEQLSAEASLIMV